MIRTPRPARHPCILHRTPSHLCRQILIPSGHLFFWKSGIHGVFFLVPLAYQLPQSPDALIGFLHRNLFLQYLSDET